jgi:multidrug resistance efflux pump
VSSRVAGRIEHLYVRQTGQPLQRGEPLFSVYSEQLQALQVDAAAPGRAILTALPRRGLCAETGLALRDLRVVDPSFRGQLQSVLVRRGAIVVALEHVKAIITADRVLLFDAANPACV